MNMPLYKMYWTRVGHVKRSRLPENVQCEVGYNAREDLKALALKDGYSYIVMCKPRFIMHSYFKVFCHIYCLREEPIRVYGDRLEYWSLVFCQLKYTNRNPEALVGKENYKVTEILQNGVIMDDYSVIPINHFNNIANIIYATYEYGRPHFEIT